MKHIFIVNPTAGIKNSFSDIEKKLKERENFDYELYVTKSKGDATKYVSQRCQSSDEDMDF